MAGEGGASNWGTLLGGVGGFLGGIAAVVGLFTAKPDLITVVVPVATLENVVERAQADLHPEVVTQPLQQPAQALETGVTMPSTPAQSLQGDVSASLLSLAETPAAFIANLRLTNESAAQVLVAGRANGRLYIGDFSLSDAMGASCPWRGAAADSLGTLPVAYGNPPVSPRNYRPVGPGQSVAVTLIFRKQHCESAPQGSRPMNLSGTFVVVEAETPRFASASFEGVTPTVAP